MVHELDLLSMQVRSTLMPLARTSGAYATIGR